MREIILDTETTGLDASKGHRIIDLACVELQNMHINGTEKQWYINPQRKSDEDSFRIHGLGDKFLSKQRLFGDIVDEFLEFIGDDALVIHNAPFDLSFLNMELAKCDKPPIGGIRVIDSLELARQKFVGSSASLDALCNRYSIDLSARGQSHGALIDARLLSRVYRMMILDGNQELALSVLDSKDSYVSSLAAGAERSVRLIQPSEAELASHKQMLSKLPSPLWESI